MKPEIVFVLLAISIFTLPATPDAVSAKLDPNTCAISDTIPSGNSRTDTLTVLISRKNFIYYYENSLAEDASNFKAAGNYKGIVNVIRAFQYEHIQDSLIYLLKIQNPHRLTDETRKIAGLIISQNNSRKEEFSQSEVDIIRLTEQVKD